MARTNYPVVAERSVRTRFNRRSTDRPGSYREPCLPEARIQQVIHKGLEKVLRQVDYLVKTAHPK